MHALHRRQVTFEEGQELAKSLHALYFECSSLNNTNVELLFHNVIEAVLKKVDTEEVNVKVPVIDKIGLRRKKVHIHEQDTARPRIQWAKEKEKWLLLII